MNLIYALVFHFCTSLISCRNVKYVELDPNKDIFDEQSSTTETDSPKIFSNQLRFLEVLPLHDDWKNTIDEHTVQSKIKNKKSLPFAIIVATPERNLDIFKKSELKPTAPEALSTAGKKPEDMSKIQVEKDESDQGGKLHNDNKPGMPLKSMEDQIGEVLFRMNTTSNTGEDDQSEINNELKLRKTQEEDEMKAGNNLENEKDFDAEMRELLTDISKEKLGNEETLLLEAKIDPKNTTEYNPELCEDSKQSDSSSEPNINNHKNHKSYKIYLVLNKYVFVK